MAEKYPTLLEKTVARRINELLEGAVFSLVAETHIAMPASYEISTARTTQMQFTNGEPHALPAYDCSTGGVWLPDQTKDRIDLTIATKDIDGSRTCTLRVNADNELTVFPRGADVSEAATEPSGELVEHATALLALHVGEQGDDVMTHISDTARYARATCDAAQFTSHHGEPAAPSRARQLAMLMREFEIENAEYTGNPELRVDVWADDPTRGYSHILRVAALAVGNSALGDGVVARAQFCPLPGMRGAQVGAFHVMEDGHVLHTPKAVDGALDCDSKTGNVAMPASEQQLLAAKDHLRRADPSVRPLYVAV